MNTHPELVTAAILICLATINQLGDLFSVNDGLYKCSLRYLIFSDHSYTEREEVFSLGSIALNHLKIAQVQVYNKSEFLQ